MIKMHNGTKVLLADLTATVNGEYKGTVLADRGPEQVDRYVTWSVESRDGELFASHGEYFVDSPRAVRRFNERRSVRFVAADGGSMGGCD